MRRRRRHLQVSTFPFLAVLLCAMGSLILLLLVIDRRAKVVALAKAQRAAALVAAEEARTEAEQQAEWERRRQALLQQLAWQDEQVRTQMREARYKLDETTAGIATTRSQQRVRIEQLEAERTRLTLAEKHLASRREQLARSVVEAEGVRKETAGLTAQLEQLEMTLLALRAAGQREQRTYSLVPYRGKRGDQRRPLTVECAGPSLIFHPDRRTLRGDDATAKEVVAEVERRLDQQRATGGAAPGAKAYLLFLVRPDGISTYYQALSTLQGLPFDFGYEFVDAEWILDLTADDDAPAPQPWMAAKKTETQAAPATLAAPRPIQGLPAASPVTPGGGGSAAEQVASRGRQAPEEPPPGPDGPGSPSPGTESQGAGGPSAPTLFPGGQRSPPDSALATPAASTPAGAKDQEPRNGSPVPTGTSPPKEQPTRLVGNRDWVIPVECTADGVVVYPSRTPLAVAALTPGPDGGNALLHTLRQLIERRQASVRPGEPPYRPQVRFLVRPEGLRAYYLAFPLLDALNVPMTRQNLRADEDVRDHL